MSLLRRVILHHADVRLDVLVVHDDIVVVREFSELDDELCGVGEVDYEYAEEKPYEKRKCQVVGQPRQRMQDVRMHEIRVDGAEHCPRQRKLRTNYALHVAPLTAVIPQADVHHLQAENSRRIFQGGHRNCGRGEKNHLAPDRVFNEDFAVNRGQEKKNAKAEAVQRDIRACAKAGVDPFFFGIALG